MIQTGTGAAFRSRARFAGSADVSSALSAKREIVLRSILAKTRPAILSARCGRDARAPSREGLEYLYLLSARAVRARILAVLLNRKLQRHQSNYHGFHQTATFTDPHV